MGILAARVDLHLLELDGGIAANTGGAGSIELGQLLAANASRIMVAVNHAVIV